MHDSPSHKRWYSFCFVINPSLLCSLGALGWHVRSQSTLKLPCWRNYIRDHIEIEMPEEPQLPQPPGLHFHQELTNMWVNQASKDSSPQSSSFPGWCQGEQTTLSLRPPPLPKPFPNCRFISKINVKPLNLGRDPATRTLYFLYYCYLVVQLPTAKSIPTWNT